MVQAKSYMGNEFHLFTLSQQCVSNVLFQAESFVSGVELIGIGITFSSIGARVSLIE